MQLLLRNQKESTCSHKGCKIKKVDEALVERPVKDKEAIKNSWYEFMKDKSYLTNLTASYDEVAGYMEKERASGYNRS